jgi:hypothetical protein
MDDFNENGDTDRIFQDCSATLDPGKCPRSDRYEERRFYVSRAEEFSASTFDISARLVLSGVLS